MKKFKPFAFIILFLSLLCNACTRQNTPQTLTFATWGSQSEIKIIKPLIEDFETQNSVKIELIHIPQNYFQKLHLLFASNQAPDVLFINNYYLPIYAKANKLEDLTPYFQTDLKDRIFFDNSIKSLTLDSRLYAIPRDISNMVIYYNKDIFKKNNIKIPGPTWTYAEFLKTAQKLTTDNQWGVGWEENPIYWEPFLWSNGATLFDNSGELLLNSTAAKHSLKQYIDLQNVYQVAPNKMQSANRTMAQMFLDEKIAMQISGRWLVPKYRAEAKFDWDIVQLPSGLKGSVAGSDASGWAISKSSQQKDLAVKFIKHISGTTSLTELTKSGLITPARKDVAYSSAFLDDKKPKNSKIFLEINKNAIVTNIPVDYNRKIEQLTRVLEPYFIGTKKITPQTKFEL